MPSLIELIGSKRRGRPRKERLDADREALKRIGVEVWRVVGKLKILFNEYRFVLTYF